MNYFKAAEQILSSVPTLERALENLRRREQILIDSGKPREIGSINYDKPFTDTHYVNDTLNELLSVAECSKNIAETRSKLNEIGTIINQMQDKHQKIIRLWYIKKCTKEEIMEKLEIESSSTLYNLRNRAVAEFALLFYGGSTLDSI